MCAVCENRRLRHATHLLLPLGSSTQVDFVPPVPSRLCACLVATDHPPGWVISVCGLLVWLTIGLWWCWLPVPRWLGGLPGGHLPVLSVDRLFMVTFSLSPMNQACFPNAALRLARVVTPCVWVLDPKELSWTDCVWAPRELILEYLPYRPNMFPYCTFGMGSWRKIIHSPTRQLSGELDAGHN